MRGGINFTVWDKEPYSGEEDLCFREERILWGITNMVWVITNGYIWVLMRT